MRKSKLLFQNELSYKAFAALHRFIFIAKQTSKIL